MTKQLPERNRKVMNDIIKEESGKRAKVLFGLFVASWVASADGDPHHQ